MAAIDDLLEQIQDSALRCQLEAAVSKLRQRTKFGLVFEEHIPETVLLSAAGIRVGSTVMLRKARNNHDRYAVERIEAGMATLRPPELSKAKWTAGSVVCPLADLLVVKPFGEPVYPVLVPTGNVEVGGDKPYSAVINGENFHALQLALYAYKGTVDCIYIDPPYNTGARDWKYNNNYVESQDLWAHSKWLSFMEKRLILAKKLLRPSSGVLIVTIDEHEVHHLGVLLEQVFPDARRQMVTIVNNAAGVTQGGFSRVEEYAIFCFLGDARPVPSADDLLSDETKAEQTPLWFSLIRYGGIDALPSKRPGMVFPIAIDPTTDRIVGMGRTLTERRAAGEVTGDLDKWVPDPGETVDGFPVVWPYRGTGALARWQMNPGGLAALVEEGFVRVRRQADGPGENQWSVSYVKSGNQAKVRSGEIPTIGREPNNGALLLGSGIRKTIPKTVWRRARHDAGKWGSRTLRELLGSVTFDYAKSPYAVLDTLRSIVGTNTNALVMDFFAGSGTTLHATAMLNAEDEGQRRCILITNNDVEDKAAKRLNAGGHFIGDVEFEAAGICRSITTPRIRAALTGKHARSGAPLQGVYLDERPMSEGFPENVVFLDLVYEDADAIDLGTRFESVVPALWLTAGGVGSLPQVMPDDD